MTGLLSPAPRKNCFRLSLGRSLLGTGGPDWASRVSISDLAFFAYRELTTWSAGDRVHAEATSPHQGRRMPEALPTVPILKRCSPDERRKVLIIEDNVDDAKTLSIILTYTGHEVRVAYTGPDGVR